MTVSKIHLHLKQVIGQQVLLKYLEPWINEYLTYDKQPEFSRIVEESTNNSKYKALVFKKFIQYVESNHDTEVHEDIFEVYASYMIPGASSDDGKNKVTYSISESIIVKLFEDPTVIGRHGCTGHRTWEAALPLCDFLLENCQEVDGPTSYVELGAGTGLVGLVASQLPHTKEVVVTDGDSTVVDGLDENIKLNKETLKSPIRSQLLWWGRDNPVTLNNKAVVLAADVTYDSDLFPSLVISMKQHLLLPNITHALVSATIRSIDTFKIFQDECEKKEIELEIIERYSKPFSSKYFFISPESPDIVIIRLSNKIII